MSFERKCQRRFGKSVRHTRGVKAHYNWEDYRKKRNRKNKVASKMRAQQR